MTELAKKGRGIGNELGQVRGEQKSVRSENSSVYVERALKRLRRRITVNPNSSFSNDSPPPSPPPILIALILIVPALVLTMRSQLSGVKCLEIRKSPSLNTGSVGTSTASTS